MSNSKLIYGVGDTTYRAVGREQGVRTLVGRFYEIMRNDTAYESLWLKHTQPSPLIEDKLTAFLAGWMGGPSNYQKKYGPINIPQAHAHLSVNCRERDLWLQCMEASLESLEYSDDLIAYLIEQLRIPAEKIHRLSQS